MRYNARAGEYTYMLHDVCSKHIEVEQQCVSVTMYVEYTNIFNKQCTVRFLSKNVAQGYKIFQNARRKAPSE